MRQWRVEADREAGTWFLDDGDDVPVFMPDWYVNSVLPYMRREFLERVVANEFKRRRATRTDLTRG